MTTSSSSQKKKTQVVADLIPNNYEEQPGLIEGKTKVFKDKVAARVDDLDNLGKFVTLFQYVLILVVILVLVLSRIFKGTTIAYSELKPSYSKYLELRSDPDVMNMKCSVSNDTLTYASFTTYSYEKADACSWVTEDLLKDKRTYSETKYVLVKDGDPYDLGDGNGAQTSYEGYVLPRSKLGKTSACKELKKLQTCQAIRDGCSRGHELMEKLIEKSESAVFPLKDLLDSESKLLSFVNATLTQSFESLLSGLEGPRIAVKEWASKNMPALYGYFGSLQNYAQGQFFRQELSSDSPTNFFKSVSIACAIYNKKIADADTDTCDTSWIGDGVCDAACNNPYCLNDGGDCLTGTALYTSSHEFWDDATDEYTYRGFSPLQQGDELFIQPYYNISDKETLFDDGMVNILKTILNANDEDVWTALENIFKEPYIHPIWQTPTNMFVGVDPNDTCGNPSTWYKSYEMDRPVSWLEALESDIDFVYDTALRDSVFPALGEPSGALRPSGFVPVQRTDVFSCDAQSKAQNLPGIKGETTANIKAWVDYSYALFAYFKDKCGADEAGHWKTDCPTFTVDDSKGTVTFPLAFLSDDKVGSNDENIDFERYDFIRLVSELEYAYLGSSARENSGSVEQLLLDAGIKRDSAGYSINPSVNYEAYYTASDVSECSYSKRVGASPATVVTVVLGLIGGVTTTVSVFALVLYQLFRKSVFKKYKNEMQSKDPSSSVPV